MSFARFLQNALLFIALVLLQEIVAGQQVQIGGTVYDRSGRYGLPAVSVISTSGAGTATDSLGRYSIKVSLSDSISFSYLGKATQKFPVKHIQPDQPFDMSLQIAAESLPPVTVRQNSYRTDSLANREEYRKVFDGNALYSLAPSSGVGLGLSLDLIFNAKKIKRFERFKERLEREEREKYIDHRFSKGLVKRITGLEEPALDTFMRNYRPTYEVLQLFENQYEYYEYIKSQANFFSATWQKK